MKPQIETTREIGPLALRASVAPDSIDEKKRTLDVVWTTGARVRRGGGFWSEPFDEELSLAAGHVRMDRLNGGAPFLNAHNGFDTGAVLGVVESARIEAGRGVATVRFASPGIDAAADQVFSKIKDGVLRNVSVGYRVHRFERVEGDQKSDVPVRRAVDWEPMEISVVPIGADAGAQFRAEGQQMNPCVFVHRNQEKTEMSKITATGDQGSETAAGAPGAPVVDTAAVRAEAVKAERTRVSEIQRFGRAFEMDAVFVQRHVDADTTPEQFRALATDERERVRPPVVRDGGGVRVTDDARDKFLRGAGDWLLTRAGVAGLVVDHAKRQGDVLKIEPGEFRGLSFMELARMSLERSGVRTAGMDRMQLIGAALTGRAASGFNGTSDFPVLLENVMHKTLLAAYGTTPDSWTQFCAVGTVSDFRPHNRYRQGTFGRLQTVNEHGEFKNQDIPDGEKQTISAITKGNMIALTRQALINDDMGAFSSLATALGRAARLSIESDVFDLIKLNGGLGPVMSDGDTLFHANHANVGAGSVLTVDGLDADRVVMAQQTDPSGNEFLDLRPAILLLAIGLGGKARVINESQFDPDSTSAFESANKVVGLFQTIVDSPRLTGTRRYLLASPSIAPTFEVAFLDGQQQPFLELQNGWRVDGVEWKVRLDYGVAAVDFRGAVTNAGV